VIAVVKNGLVERIVETTDGINLDGRITVDVPGDYDPTAVNYVFDGSAFVPNVVLAMIKLRAERDARLSACDWTQLVDTPSAISEAWAPYRQALRDMPGTTTDPFAPQWPTLPA